jgi:hypothetical protein
VTLRNGNRREAIVDEELAEIADKIKNSWKFYADIYEVKRIILNWLMR